MKRNSILPWLIASIFFLISYGTILGDGFPPPDPNTPPPYDPTTDPAIKGAYLKGTFTAAYDKKDPTKPPNYMVQVILKWEMDRNKVRTGDKGREKWISLTLFKKNMKIAERVIPSWATPLQRKYESHLFSFYVPVSQINLCTYETGYLKRNLNDKVTELGVAKAFGWPSDKAYLSKVNITMKSSCGDLSRFDENAMIAGEVEIFLYQ